ncbi:MAG: hypothetical protein LBJ00_05940 [Planctomycetaceae bacterium]|nr:hypothetical protein [Planctomycetaceae bacterium]
MFNLYTITNTQALSFALEQPLHVVALVCSASGILKQLEYEGVLKISDRCHTLYRSR